MHFGTRVFFQGFVAYCTAENQGNGFEAFFQDFLADNLIFIAGIIGTGGMGINSALNQSVEGGSNRKNIGQAVIPDFLSFQFLLPGMGPKQPEGRAYF
jgi:hypothetical protein